MAKKNLQDTSKAITNSFIKGLNKDADPSYVTEGMWTHAINMVNNSKIGKVGSISNESANYICFTTGLTMPLTVTEKLVIGVIYLFSDKWIVFTAGHDSQGRPISAEIGLFEEELCLYRPIVQDPCLAFDKRFLISGAARLKSDCSWQVYWADGLNPDRYLNIGDPKSWPPSNYIFNGGTGLNGNYYIGPAGSKILWPGVQWNQKCTDENEIVVPKLNYTPIGCITCTNLNTLDCTRIRIARLMETPCLNLKLGVQGGTLANGTYFAVIAYLIDGQRVTDYFSQSNNQPVFYVNDLAGSLDLDVHADSDNFDEFELVIVQNINQGTVAKRIGNYSTKTTRISIDQINPSNITVPLEQLPIVTPVYEKSDQMAQLNSYLLRVGPTSKFDFNYQPLANLIQAKWASVEYPGDYYMKGGNKTNYLRDEVYAFFIRWVYDTGDKSPSYHIPGRVPRDFNIPGSGTINETATIYAQDSLTTDDKTFEVFNTASVTTGSYVGTTTDDGGTVLAVGDMGYWQSSEKYPDNRADIWNPSYYCWTTPAGKTGVYDLCGKNIRHHKFPEDYINGSTNTNVTHFASNPNPATVGSQYTIRLLGVYFENIILPKDNDGVDIPGLVGYEILRGSREGNKTIIAKGMVNNFRTYKLRGAIGTNRTGLYANYPFNTITPITSPLNGHAAGVNDPYIQLRDADDNYYSQEIPEDIFTFHSPDTMFRTPFLSTQEFKLYGVLSGYSNQQFQEPSQHPRFKLLADDAIKPMLLLGIAEAIVSMVGKRTDSTPSIIPATGVSDGLAVAYGAYVTAATGLQTLPTPLTSPITLYNTFFNNYYSSGAAIADIGLSLLSLPTTVDVAEGLIVTALNATSIAQVNAPIIRTGTIELPDYAYLPGPLKILGGLNQALFYFSEGADIALRILYASTSYKQYALQQIAYGYYGTMTPPSINNLRRFKIEDSFYLRDNIQEVSRYQNSSGAYVSYNINNLKRSASVVVRTVSGPYKDASKPNGVTTGPYLLPDDKSLTTLGGVVQGNQSYFLPGTLPTFERPTLPFSLPIQSHYGALKGRVRNQYGQLDSIKQIVITPCEQTFNTNEIVPTGPTICLTKPYLYKTIQRTPILFGGDTYINRYTEKNNMMFFYDWLYDQPDGFEYNYYLRNMIPNPRFRLNSTLYDVQNLASLISFSASPSPGTGALPSIFYNLDYYFDSIRFYNYNNDTLGNPEALAILLGTYDGLFSVKKAFFYLANSSIRDFFVESDVIVDFSQQGETIGEKHYDPYRYTDYFAMFDMNPLVMGRNSAYIYDYSLSVSKLYNQYFSAGLTQSRYYDPNVAALCFTYYPNRVIYSLPQQNESVKDSWFIYLANNYNQFLSQISGVKAINKSGVIFTFKNDSPVMYQGVDTLQTDLGTKITIGDGGLFSQPQQAITNADKAYEYGASQNRLSVISTPVGIYYMSQSAGKVFSFGDGLQEISQNGMKWWFTLFLPYKLTEDFPNYPYQDNPVAGIGCQSVYDNTNGVLYFAKKDYKLKSEYEGRVTYVPLNLNGTGDYFLLDGNSAQFRIGNPFLFDDASWTISYDPKNQFWISFLDWHPDLLIPTKDVFISTKKNGGWRHNWSCTKFCNYYGTDYACEIEIPIVTGQNVMTTRSIEYILEAYRRSNHNCVDQHHVLDFNFDTAVIYNSEQVSGYLNLNIYPKNDINLSRQYPKLNANNSSFDILFSKEENKFRFNQFWDITKNRGEFPIGSNYPPTGPVIPGTTVLNGNYESQNTWITAPDGYTRILNPNNLSYNKSDLQRKKFRHYLNFLNLKRNVSNDINFILKVSNSKNEISFR